MKPNIFKKYYGNLYEGQINKHYYVYVFHSYFHNWSHLKDKKKEQASKQNMLKWNKINVYKMLGTIKTEAAENKKDILSERR